MIKYIAIAAILSSGITIASDFKGDFSGDINLEQKSMLNSKAAKNNGQGWSSSALSMGQANIDGKLEIWNNKIDINWFLKYTNSKLYQDGFSAYQFSTFPRSVIARNVFKLRRLEKGKRTTTESTLNKFVYTWTDSDGAFTMGRMFINFGHGETFNPINPFNFSKAFTSAKSINQGNDGMRLIINSSDELKLHMYFLGDKAFTDYDGVITRTLMLRGDWKVSSDLRVNYILGEDQKRHKYGAEIAHKFGKELLFLQMLKTSQRIDKESTYDKGLFNYVTGYQKRFSKSYTGRVEFGKIGHSEKFPTADHSLDHIPQSTFAAIVNKFRFSSLVKITANAAVDLKSHFSYYHFNVKHDFKKTFNFNVFAAGPMSKPKDDADLTTQNYVAHELGIGIKAKF